MDQQTVLVIGATGTVGAPVARQLRDDGYHVRLLVRDAARAAARLGSGFAYIQGRVEERETVTHALSGCIGVHISLQAGSNPADIERVEHRGALRVIELAAQQRLAHLTYVSGMSVGAKVDSAVLAIKPNGVSNRLCNRVVCPSPSSGPPTLWTTCPSICKGSEPWCSESSLIRSIS